MFCAFILTYIVSVSIKLRAHISRRLIFSSSAPARLRPSSRPAKMSAEAMKMRHVIGSPMKTTPRRLPKMPEVERSIANVRRARNFLRRGLEHERQSEAYRPGVNHGEANAARSDFRGHGLECEREERRAYHSADGLPA